MKRKMISFLFTLAICPVFAGCASVTTPSSVVSQEVDKKTFTIQFDPNGGHLDSTKMQVKENEAFSLPTPTKEGKTFLGWYTGWDINDGVVTNASSITHDMTLYAKWNSYTVAFMLDENTVYSQTEVEPNSTVSSPSEKVHKTVDGKDYEIDHWNFDFATKINKDYQIQGTWKEYQVSMPSKLTIWMGAGHMAEKAISDIADDFKKQYPNTAIDIRVVAGTSDKVTNYIKRGIPVGNKPDIALMIPADVPQIISNLADVSSYVNDEANGLSQTEKEDYLPSLFESGSKYQKEGIYSLPASTDSLAMFYNPALLGLNLSSFDSSINGGKALDESYLNDLTWEEMFGKLCPAILKYNQTLPENGKILNDGASVIAYNQPDFLFQTLAYQYGYDCVSVNSKQETASYDFDNQGMKSIVTKFHSAYQNKFIRCDQNHATWNTLPDKDAVFYIEPSSYASGYYDGMDIQVAKMPHAEGKPEAYPMMQGRTSSFVIFSNQDKDQVYGSWEFYKFFTSPSNNAKWALQANALPVRKSAFKEKIYQGEANPSNYEAKTAQIIASRAYLRAEDFADNIFSTPSPDNYYALLKQTGILMLDSENAQTEEKGYQAKLDADFSNAVVACQNNIY